MFSALEVFYENALYKFTFDIDIDIVQLAYLVRVLPCACILDIRIYFRYFLVYLSKFYKKMYTVIVSNLLQLQNVYCYGATG